MRFRATITSTGRTTAGILVPDDVMATLPSRRAPVRVTINGFTFRTSVGTVDGQAMVGVSNDVRAQTGLAAGDEVDVELEHDTAPREIAVPDDLAAALAERAGAREAFDRLSYSAKRAIVEPITAARAAETRQRRVDAAVAKLAG
jgi:hypothetical protein